MTMLWRWLLPFFFVSLLGLFSVNLSVVPRGGSPGNSCHTLITTCLYLMPFCLQHAFQPFLSLQLTVKLFGDVPEWEHLAFHNLVVRIYSSDWLQGASFIAKCVGSGRMIFFVNFINSSTIMISQHFRDEIHFNRIFWASLFLLT